MGDTVSVNLTDGALQAEQATEMESDVATKLRGYYQYYGIRGNHERIRDFFYQASGFCIGCSIAVVSARTTTGKDSPRYWSIFNCRDREFAMIFELRSDVCEASNMEEPSASITHKSFAREIQAGHSAASVCPVLESQRSRLFGILA
jgi:hypothetical protein